MFIIVIIEHSDHEYTHASRTWHTVHGLLQDAAKLAVLVEVFNKVHVSATFHERDAG